jgi:hypothetical protein
MAMDFGEPVRRERDRRLRRGLLEVLYLARGTAPMKGVSGRRAVMSVEQSIVSDMRFDGDTHAVSLLQDLADKGLVALERRARRKGEAVTPDHLFARVTDAGARLYREEAPADPDIWDPRATGDEA